MGVETRQANNKGKRTLTEADSNVKVVAKRARGEVDNQAASVDVTTQATEQESFGTEIGALVVDAEVITKQITGQDVVGLIDRLDVCGVLFVIAHLVRVAKPTLCVICLLYLSTAGCDEDA